ncbi:MAG: hypothetical protein ChlgKO_13570 [Chlamydiales bacterium]
MNVIIEPQIIDFEKFKRESILEKENIIHHPLNRSKIPALRRKALAPRVPQNATPAKRRQVLENAKTVQADKINRQFEKLIKSCFRTYQNSAHTELGFKLLGCEKLRENEEYLNTYGVLSTDAPLLPSRFALSDEVSPSKGSILSDSDWSIFKNDSVMLGTIHTFQTVYIDGDPAKLKITFFFDSQENRPRLVGREIAMLIAGGYKQIGNGDLGLVFGCFDRNLAKQATIPKLIRAAEKIRTEEDFKTLMRENSISLSKWNARFGDQD